MIQNYSSLQTYTIMDPMLESELTGEDGKRAQTLHGTYENKPRRSMPRLRACDTLIM